MGEELEELFTDESVDKVLQIYELYSRESVISWMKNREAEKMEIRQITGNEEIAVVIPTSNADGQLAKRAVELFKGASITLVESKGKKFNFAKSVNAGILKVMEYKPSWIVVANDDTTYAEPVTKLMEDLSRTTKTLVMAKPSGYHSYKVSLIRPDENFLKGMVLFGKVLKLGYAEITGKLYLKYREKFKLNTMVAINSMMGPMRRFAGEVKEEVVNAGSFMILRRSRVKVPVLNEVFINGYEDLLLSMNLRNDYEVIDYRLDEMRGASLGFGKLRFARNFVNEIYLNYLLQNG
ncbi:hypothetical protein HS7_13500 [Sulfolobales archaeon HS-7]|nr:hypothetical protein HS7_13500 [Sulfolobales archaeon HS-7]